MYGIYMASVETDASPPARSAAPLIAAGVAAAFAAAGLLWWRFGDRLYALGLMEAFLACF
jgi:hypothetical protein